MSGPVPPPGRTGVEPGYPHARRNGFALAAGMLAVASGFGISLTFVPLLLQELGVQEHVETWTGYAVGGFFWVSFLLTPFWGMVADHFGRKSMVLRTGLGMGLLTATAALAPSPGWLVAIFVLAGTTQGFVGATQALLVTTTPPTGMGRALSLLQSSNLIGNAIGPALGAALGIWFGSYRLMFVVAGALMLTGGAISLLFTRESHRRPPEPFRPRLLRDMARVARIPDMPVLFAGAFIFAMSLFGSVSVISIFAVNLLGGAGGENGVDFWVGAASVAVTVSSGVAVYGWGLLMDRAGAAPVLALSLLLGAAGMLPVALVRTPLELVAARALTGVLIAGIVPAQVAMTRLRAPMGMEARVLAYGTTFTILGMGVGPLLAGWIGPWLGLRAYFVLNAAALLAVGLLWVRCWRRGAEAPAGG